MRADRFMQLHGNQFGLAGITMQSGNFNEIPQQAGAYVASDGTRFPFDSSGGDMVTNYAQWYASQAATSYESQHPVAAPPPPVAPPPVAPPPPQLSPIQQAVQAVKTIQPIVTTAAPAPPASSSSTADQLVDMVGSGGDVALPGPSSSSSSSSSSSGAAWLAIALAIAAAAAGG